MATGNFPIEAGSPADGQVATYTFTEDALLKLLQRVVLSDSTGAEINFGDPVPLVGADGVLIMSNANPLPISDAGGSITVDGSVTALGGGSAATPATSMFTIQGLQADDAALGATVTNPVPIGGKYNSTLPAYTNGDRAQAQFTAAGALIINGPIPHDSPDAGNPVKIGARYSSAGIAALTDADVSDLLVTDRGYLKVAIGAGNNNSVYTGGIQDAFSNGNNTVYASAQGLVFNGSTSDRNRSIAASFGSATGVPVVEQAGSPFVHLTASGAVKTGAGILHSVTVNTLSAGAITVYDNTAASGTVIAIINGGAERTIVYNLAFATGCHLGITGTPDVTVVYR
jgi:hypothetical protein